MRLSMLQRMSTSLGNTLAVAERWSLEILSIGNSLRHLTAMDSKINFEEVASQRPPAGMAGNNKTPTLQKNLRSDFLLDRPRLGRTSDWRDRGPKTPSTLVPDSSEAAHAFVVFKPASTLVLSSEHLRSRKLDS